MIFSCTVGSDKTLEKLWELMFPKHEGAPRCPDGTMISEEQRCSSIRVMQNSRSRDPGVARIKKDGDSFREPQTRGHRSRVGRSRS